MRPIFPPGCSDLGAAHAIIEISIGNVAGRCREQGGRVTNTTCLGEAGKALHRSLKYMYWYKFLLWKSGDVDLQRIQRWTYKGYRKILIWALNDITVYAKYIVNRD